MSFAILLFSFAIATSLTGNVAHGLSTTTKRTIYPEVHPGPGLPTLAELNLTSEALYTISPKFDSRELGDQPALASRSSLYTDNCQTYSTANVDDVIACFNYLENIGSNTCGFSGDNVQFCYAGTAQITGSNIFEDPVVASLCSDVALGVQWIFTYCNVGGQVGGLAAAYGNGDLIVGVENVDQGCCS
ncbi:hypothetical protein C8R42DRAFT_643442 [Lentinula raphanica]|nr:hypothetical protein C8R42DRAFT_643442 [Lentinula raphanica]